MVASVGDFARSAVAAYRRLSGFEATETIRGGAFEIKGRVRFLRPERVSVEYSIYRDPIEQLDEALTAAREFTGDELLGMWIAYDGHQTWVYDPKTNVAIKKPWRALFEPLPGIDSIAEIGFLDWLTQGFLLRDAGTEVMAGRKARVIGLKPKRPYRSQLLLSVSFPILRGSVGFDEETLFPLRITFFPSRGSALFPLLGPDRPITIEYNDLRLEPPEPEAFNFSPPDDARVFVEEPIDRDRPIDRLPFPLAIDPILNRGFQILEGGTSAVDEKNEKGYCTIVFARKDGDQTPLLTLRAGNYLSRNMSRRKRLIGEKGENIELSGRPARLLDRRSLWDYALQDGETHPLSEVSWERDGLFLFLIGDGIEKEELISLADALDIEPGS